MKFSFLLISLGIVLSGCDVSSKDYSIIFGKKHHGSGPIEQKEYDMTFDGIKVSQGIDVEVLKSTEEKVVLSAPSDILNQIIIEKSGSDVYIHLASDSNISTERVEVKIFAQEFSKLQASSSAEIHVKDKFLLENLGVSVSSSGRIEGNLEANNFTIQASSSGDFQGTIWAVKLIATVSSSGDIEISGQAKSIDFSASSSGSIDAEELNAENAEIKVSSSATVKVGVLRNLAAKASSSGDIIVFKRGNLNVLSKDESSSGRVQIKD